MVTGYFHGIFHSSGHCQSFSSFLYGSFCGGSSSEEETGADIAATSRDCQSALILKSSSGDLRRETLTKFSMTDW